MEHLISPDMSRVLQHIEGLDFIITGSLALCIEGKLDREIHDLDIITPDNRVLKQLDKIGERLDETSEAHHLRYLCYNSYHVDVFLVSTHIKHTTKNIGKFKLKVAYPETVYLSKIASLCRHTNTPFLVKALKDLEQYFHITYPQ